MSRIPGRRNREEALHNLEIARTQRLLPVQYWEKAWVTPEGALPGSTYKVLKWVKTDKKQDFSDEEGETDERQLAAVRDEIEALAGAADQEIEELDQEGDEREGESRVVSPGPAKEGESGPVAKAVSSKAPQISLNPPSPEAMDVEPSADPGGITPSPAPTTEPTTPGNTMDL